MVDKILKSCIRCRKHKTKCDAFIRKPLPCSNCKKRAISCKFGTVDSESFDRTKLSSAVIESLTSQIHQLNRSVDDLIVRKSLQLDRLVQLNPSIYQIQSILHEPIRSNSQLLPLNSSDSSVCTTGEFVINCDPNASPVSLTYNDAVKYFNNYFHNFHKHLPVLPTAFYHPSNINKVYKDHNLLFWSIVLTSHLNLDRFNQYSGLARHIKTLVVQTCWLQTPRSVYVLISLLILTTWPIPVSTPGGFEESGNDSVNDNLSIKYLSLLKNLSLQLGLHRLQFINEFLLKTTINLSSDLNLDNVIRERIYKFITINSNYWLINLGLLNLNFNGFQEDYIINKGNNELKKLDANTPHDDDDKYINSLLKVSIIQQRLNENLNNEEGNRLSKLIDLNMFEVILNDLKNPSNYPNLLLNDSIQISIEYCKLQIYLYSFNINLQLSISDYKQNVYKALHSCYKVVNYFKKEFSTNKNFLSHLPIHYKFIFEFVSLLLLRIYYSPLLNSVQDYEVLKQNFLILYDQLIGCKNLVNNKLIQIINKFNQIFKFNLLSLLKFNKSWYMLNKFNNHQISNINYELIYLIFIFETDRFKLNENDLDWHDFGITDENLLAYLKKLQLF